MTMQTNESNNSVNQTLQSVISQSQQGWIGRFVSRQEVWITVSVVVMAAIVSTLAPRFGSIGNIANIAQNFSFIALLAIGMTPVIITGGIDISVGSLLGFCAVMFALLMTNGNSFWLSAAVGVGSGIGLGLVNGMLISYARLPPFIVTLAMLSAARSLTLVVSNNQIVYDFGPDSALMTSLGAGWTLGLPNVLLAALIAAVVLYLMLTMTRWGRWVHAIGGNEDAADSVGIPVARVMVTVYAFSGLMCGIAAILIVGWLGSVTNALGTGLELQVIAAVVIGGASLKGGYGSAYGALIGAVLVEIIRNALLIAGINPFWQGMFVGGFIIFAVLLERLKVLRSA